MALPFTYKRKVTVYQDGSTSVDAGGTAPSITNGVIDLPVLVFIDSNSWNDSADIAASGFLDDLFDGTNNPGGKRVKFYLSEADLVADTNELSYEVADFDTAAEEAEYHVKRTTGSSSTEIWIGFGEGASGWPGTDQDDPAGVWNSDIEAVYHFGDGSTLDLADSTSNGHTLTNVGSSVLAAAGLISGAADFDAAADTELTAAAIWDTMPTGTGDDSIAFECWFNTDTTYTAGSPPSTNLHLTSKNNLSAQNRFYVYINTSSALILQGEENNNGNLVLTSTTTTWTAGTWYHVCGLWSETLGMELWVNGVRETNSAGNTTLMANGSSDNYTIGGTDELGGVFNWDGQIDEVRVYSGTTIPVDWCKSSYYSALKTNYPGDNWMVWSAAEANQAFSDNDTWFRCSSTKPDVIEVVVDGNLTTYFKDRQFILFGSSRHPLSTKTSNYILTGVDHTILVDATSGNLTMTLPAAVGVTGRTYEIKKIDSSSNTVTIDGDGSETIDGATTQVIIFQYDGVQLRSDGSGWVLI